MIVLYADPASVHQTNGVVVPNSQAAANDVGTSTLQSPLLISAWPRLHL